jgi:phosphate transport system permease protein
MPLMPTGVDQQPRKLSTSTQFHRGDRIFNRLVTIAAFTSLFVLLGIATFLGSQMIPVIQEQGWSFFTTTEWTFTFNSADDEAKFGILGMMYGSILLAVIALVISVPVSILLAIFVVFLAPARVAKIMTNFIDLMAAIPSIIIGLWGLYVFQPVGVEWARILNEYLGWIPIFSMTSDNFIGSSFIAGWILAIMMIPIVTAVTREVLDRTPPDLVNAAESLGCSLWTMLRYVALPFGRGGLVGGVMLGLGRALGETVAVYFVLKLVFDINLFRILDSGGGSIATMIVAKFGEAGPKELQVLLASGFVLFIGTLVVNIIANYIVSRTGKLKS